MSVRMDVAFDLAKINVDTEFENLPEEAVQVAKKFIIDSIAVAISGSRTDNNAEVINLVRNWGGKDEGSVWVYGFKGPSPEVTFANSQLIHSPDFDDTDDGTATHD
jgi:2-methylcitrate dehydratase PrpD